MVTQEDYEDISRRLANLEAYHASALDATDDQIAMLQAMQEKLARKLDYALELYDKLTGIVERLAQVAEMEIRRDA